MAATTYIKDLSITSNSTTTSYLIEPTLYGAATTNDSGLTYSLSLDSTFGLINGVVVQAKFTTANKANATLQVNNTGAKSIYYNNAQITESALKVNHTYDFVYDGTQWQLIGELVGGDDKYHTTGSWNNLTYTATAVNNAGELAFTIPTGTTETTLALGNHTHNYAGSDSAGGAANSLKNFTTTTTSSVGLEITTAVIGYVSELTKADWNYQQTDGILYGQFYNASWKGEIFQDYRTGQLSVRGKNNGTWQGWRRILDETNGATILGLGTFATKSSLAFSELSSHPTTLSGYGITDASIVSDVITLGSSTITPVTSVNGHTGSSISVTAGDLGLSSALRFVGKTTSTMIDGFVGVPAGISGYNAPIVGDVVIDSSDDAEYVCISKSGTTYTWELLGRDSSWALDDHVHGNLTNDGRITSTTAIANGDSLVIVDADSSAIKKIIATTITFDGTSDNKALTQKGTWEEFNNYSHPTGAGNKHIPSGGSAGQFLKYGGSSGTASWDALPTASTSEAGIIQIGTGSSNALAGNTNVNNVFQDAITYTDYNNWRPLIWGNSNDAAEGFTPADSTAGVFTAASLTCQPSTGTIRIMNIKLVGTSSSAITYTDGTNEKEMIKFVKGNNNGHAIKIGGCALTVIAAGESVSIAPSATSEDLYLLADSTTYVYANANTLANRIGFAVNTSGAIIPIKAEAANNNAQDIGTSSNRWANIYTNNLNSSHMSLSEYMNTILVGTGTAAVTSGTKMPALWKFNLGIASPTEGDIVTIKIPVAGHGNGVFVSLDNGTTYYPVSVSGTGALTTHYAKDQIITLVCVGSGGTNNIYPAKTTINSNSYTLGTAANITGKHWCVVNYYDSGNTNTATRQKVRSTDANYSLLFADPVVGTADNNTNYYTYRNDSIYVNPSTGNVYATAFNGALNGNATTATGATNDSEGNAINSTYLKKSGGQMTGHLTWKDEDALPEATSISYLLGIDAFANGGTTKWISAANVRTSIGAAAASHGTHVPSSGTTAQFLRGDNTWSNTLLGPLKIGSSDAAADTGYATANVGVNNYITFYGVYGDGAGNYNHTYIGERIYGAKTSANESSELLIYHGNDTADRVRVFSGNFQIDVYTTATGGLSFMSTGESANAIQGFKVNGTDGIILGNTTAIANGVNKTIINGHVVIDTSYNTSNSYSEGLRINKGSNNWSLIQLGGAAGSTSGTDANQYLIGCNGTNLYLSHNGSNNATSRITGHKDTGWSIRPRLYINEDVATVYNFSVNGSANATTYTVNDVVRLEWNSTDNSLDFIFA